jgi:hypothetical protein
MNGGEDIDLLNDLLAAAEDRLAGLMLGVSASVPLEPGVDLVFRKRGGSWGLYVGGESVLKLSKRVRVLAAGKLEDMVGALTAEASRQLEDVRAAIAKVEAFLAAFNEGPPG